MDNKTITKNEYNFVNTFAKFLNGKMSFNFIDRKNALAFKKVIISRYPLRIAKLHKEYCRIHPEYIEDFIGSYDVGFGNSDYQNNYMVYSVRIY